MDAVLNWLQTYGLVIVKDWIPWVLGLVVAVLTVVKAWRQGGKAAIGDLLLGILNAFQKNPPPTGGSIKPPIGANTTPKAIAGLAFGLIMFGCTGCATWGPMNTGADVKTKMSFNRGGLNPGFSYESGGDGTAKAETIEYKNPDGSSIIVKGLDIADNKSTPRLANVQQMGAVPAILDAQGRVVGYVGSAGSQIISSAVPLAGVLNPQPIGATGPAVTFNPQTGTYTLSGSGGPTGYSYAPATTAPAVQDTARLDRMEASINKLSTAVNGLIAAKPVETPPAAAPPPTPVAPKPAPTVTDYGDISKQMMDKVRDTTLPLEERRAIAASMILLFPEDKRQEQENLVEKEFERQELLTTQPTTGASK